MHLEVAVHDWLDRYEGFYNNIVNFIEQHLVVDLVGGQHLSESTQAPF